ncbi:MAG: peroxiredoxin [Thermoanaerobaculia bacterium]|nr:peroxiredoxin [Thermoanaerobaculia bacterium]
MPIAVGDRMPDVELARMRDGRVERITTGELFGEGRSVLFAVPGAFTPTCTDAHLPGFQARADELAARGVDRIACVSVNDVFVMAAWGEDNEVGGTIEMLADGNGELARAMGLEMDASRFGMGRRSRRYAAVVEDGVVQMLGVEPAGGVEASSAEAVLDWLRRS